MTDSPAPVVICFGEVLWDSLPRGLFLGGAPVNVAYHLKQLGAAPLPVTSVGRDQLGEEILRRVHGWGVAPTGITTHPNKSTGMARVTLKDGSPRFEIVEEVAWDWIELSAEVLACAPRSHAVVFGSLAQRSENNRRQLTTLLEACPQAMKVFDVNLRPPYDSAERVWALAQRASLVKLSDSELNQLLERAIEPQDFSSGVKELAHRAGGKNVCLTAGAIGAGLLLEGHWFWESARAATVCDTVGAGDSFLAGLLAGLLQAKHPPAEILRRACRLAEFVVTQAGATPAYRMDETGLVTG